jgi:localization factor PodJL
MHVTAMMHYEGLGGPKNETSAAEWFKRAAELGLADSQFNIGQLYEVGRGVTQNSAEAYKWYLLASRSGTDAQRAQARTAADRVKITLPADARSMAERVASDFAARAGAPVQITAPGVDVASVQRALARLGYYRGEPNGVASPALRTAVQDFQHDIGLAQNGQVDTITAMKLKDFMRE